MKILITGGAGFIGAHVAKKLAARGEAVTLFDDFNDFIYPSRLKRQRVQALVPKTGELVEGSILDEAKLDTLFRRGSFDAVIHLAAHANPTQAVNNPNEYTQVNLVGTVNVLRAMTKHGCGQMIFAGTSSVYHDERIPFKEDQYPLRPNSAYGASKAAAEVYCSMWHALYGPSITILRFFSVYGPWGRPDMAPSIFAQHILDGQPLEISEDRQRDFTYIDDTVTGIILALDKKLGFDIFNIGSGHPVALLDFITALEKAHGKAVEHRMRKPPAGEMRITYADTTKAKQLLGYAPKTSLEEGTKQLIDWMKAWRS